MVMYRFGADRLFYQFTLFYCFRYFTLFYTELHRLVPSSLEPAATLGTVMDPETVKRGSSS